MKKCFRRSFLLLSSIFYIPAALAQSVDTHITLDKNNPTYENTADLSTVDGYNVWLNGIQGFSGKLINTGALTVTGNGYSIYETPYQTRPVNLELQNTGTIQRIQLEETAGSAIQNGELYSSSDALIQGSVLLGVNSSVLNTGTFDNLDLDYNGFEKGNLISLGHGGQFLNGNAYMKHLEFEVELEVPDADDGSDITSTGKITQIITLDRPVYTNATLNTDRVQFAQNGFFRNIGAVDNKSVTFGDNGELRNIGFAYNVPADSSTESDGYLPVDSDTETGGVFKTETLSFAANSAINNEMGASLTVTNLIMGANAQLTNGADYSLSGMSEADPFYKKLRLETKPTDVSSGEEESDAGDGEEVFFAPIPKSAEMHITNAALGENSVVNLNMQSVYTGETFTAQAGGKLNIAGAEMTLTKEDGTSTLFMGAGSSITLSNTEQEEITQPKLGINSDSGAFEIGEEVIVPKTNYYGSLTVDNLLMGANSTITNEGTITTQKTIMDDFGVINNLNYPLIFTASDYLIFKENGTLNNGDDKHLGMLVTPNLIFGNNGTITNLGYLRADNITMGNNAIIDTYLNIAGYVTVGSDSKATMLGKGSASSDLLDKENFSGSTGFTGGFTKAEGAENVQLVSDVPLMSVLEDGTIIYQHGWLAGGVNVDSILIKQGELWAQDDLRGQIDINTDSALRLVGTDVTVHDPIMKLEDAANTRLIVDLDGDDHFYNTTNSILVDHIILLGGGMQIQTPVQAQEITFGSNTTVRLKGNYYVGDMVERDGDASNTTLDIDAGAGKSIDSTGTIRLDRVVVESGAFNVNHTVEAVYRAENGVMPSAHEEGLELGTDTVVNLNAADVKVNRIVRNQLAIEQGEDVTNTTVRMRGGNLQVERNVDLDQLYIDSGKFEFMNSDTNNVVNIGNNIHISNGGQIAGDGVINLKSGSMDVDYGGRLSVSTQLVSDKNIGTMQVIQSEETFSNANNITDRGNATVNMAKGSILDLRADGANVDKIDVSGTVNLADGTRIVVRNIQANQSYELMSATQLNGNMDKLATSFLWTDTQLSNQDNKLMLEISGVQTLNEGISGTRYSKNVWNIAQTLTTINESTASNTVDPFLDNVFYALTADTAVQVMNEYSPEGYLNTYQNALRTNRNFRQSALSELDTMRTYRDVENNYQQMPGVYNPSYYGRPGYESYYAGWTNRQGMDRRRTRTDKGGLWAKPFAVSVSQDDKENMSGYEIKNYGITAGLDRRLGAVSLGLMGLYATGSINQSNKVIETDTSTYGLGIYGNYRPRKTRQFFDFYALWTETKNKSTHKINTLVESAKADYNITGYSVGADMGYDMPLTRNVIITPKVGIDYTKLEMDEIAEKGTSHSLLKVTADEFTSIQTPIEVRAAFNYSAGLNKFKPEVHARWTHEFGDTAAKGKSLFVNYNQPFTATGLNADKDVFTLGGSLLWLYNVSELELRYDYDFSESSTGHTVNVGYKYLF